MTKNYKRHVLNQQTIMGLKQAVREHYPAVNLDQLQGNLPLNKLLTRRRLEKELTQALAAQNYSADLETVRSIVRRASRARPL